MQEGLDADHGGSNGEEARAGAPPAGATSRPSQRRQSDAQAGDRASEGTELCAPPEEVEEEERLRAAREEAESKVRLVVPGARGGVVRGGVLCVGGSCAWGKGGGGGCDGSRGPPPG